MKKLIPKNINGNLFSVLKDTNAIYKIAKMRGHTNILQKLLEQPSTINRVVKRNGKIELQLPTHTKENPRAFIIDPKSNGKYRIHMKTWDGDHIPTADLSSLEKQALFEATSREIPAGGEILVPKSNSKYLGTRGTIAALKRLEKDPRYIKGSSGQVMYLDKDNKIKIYDTHSAIKTSPWGRLPYEDFYNPTQYQPTVEEVFKGSKTKLMRTLKDAGYLEMVQKRLNISRKEAKKLIESQLDAIDFIKLGNNLEGTPINGVSALSSRPAYNAILDQIFGGVYKSKKSNPDFMQVLEEQLNPQISFHPELMAKYPGTIWFNKGAHEIGHLSTMGREQSSNPYFKQIGKHNKQLASIVKDIIKGNYNKNPWDIPTPKSSKYKGEKVIDYLTQADELRVRALKLERIKQTTGKDYEEILNNPDYLKDSDIKQMKDLYDKANYEYNGEQQNAILQFLTQYVKQGGKL